jgi:hypothetical protein
MSRRLKGEDAVEPVVRVAGFEPWEEADHRGEITLDLVLSL